MLERRLAAVLRAALLSAILAPAAHALFPDRPITLVVPLPAGGTADLLCRLAADKAGNVLGQQILIENRAGGAGGRIGTESVLRSPPDGYTLLCAPQLAYSITHLLFANAAFDPRAMEPISVLATYPLIVLARPGLPIGSMPELIAYARANPGKVNYGHQGKGNTGHLLGERMMFKGQFKMTEIPYRGSAPAINDLLAGNIDVMSDYLLANKQNIDTGKLKMLATAGRTRLADYPNVPTLSETLDGLYADTWMGIAAPPGTAKPVAATLSAAVAAAFQTPELRARMLALEAEPLGSTPEVMRDMIGASEKQWRPIIEAAKIVIE